MKKFVLILVLCMLIFVFVGCSSTSLPNDSTEPQKASQTQEESSKDQDEHTSNDLSETETRQLDDGDAEEQPLSLEERLGVVVDEICNQDKQFERNANNTYLPFGLGNILAKATESELLNITNLVDQLETAIAGGQSLLPQEHQFASGAPKLVEDLDSALYSIWHRALTKQ